VEFAGEFTRGITRFTRQPSGSTLISRKVNVRAFLDLFAKRVAAPPR
jgi:hypothetical protein